MVSVRCMMYGKGYARVMVRVGYVLVCIEDARC
jgi:hypothetical protein